jgi:hypothetical protein
VPSPKIHTREVPVAKNATGHDWRNLVIDLLGLSGGEGLRTTFSSPSVTSDTTLTQAHYRVRVDASGGAVTITLPPASKFTGKVYRVKKVDSSANTVTIVPDGSDVIDGAASIVLAAYESAQLEAYETGWDIV